MKKLTVCILFFIFHICYCQPVFAVEEGWFPDELNIHYEPEKGMVVQTGDYEIDMKNKIFIKENNIMIPVKEIIDIGMRQKDNIVVLQEYEKNNNIIIELIQIAEKERADVILQKDEYRKTTTLYFKGNSIVFFEGKKDVWINGETRYLYTVPYITEHDVYVSVKDIPTLFTIVETHYKAKKDYAYWIYNGGENGEKIDVKQYQYIDKKYRLSALQSQLFEVDKKVPVDTTEKGRVFQIENQNIAVKEVSSYIKNDEIMTELFLFNKTMPYILYDTCYEINWNDAEKTAHIKIWNILQKDIVIKAGSNIITINGKDITMPVEAEIKNNKIHIPFNILMNIFEIPNDSVYYNEYKTDVTFSIKELQ